MTAWFFKANSGYTAWSNSGAKPSFSFKRLQFVPTKKIFIELDKFKERYMFEPPIMSVNNIIIGQTYVDISGKSSLINLNKSGERVDLEFFHRASSAKNAFKV